MNDLLFVLCLFALAGIMCLFGIMYAVFGILGYFQRCEARLDMLGDDEL